MWGPNSKYYAFQKKKKKKKKKKKTFCLDPVAVSASSAATPPVLGESGRLRE